MTPVFYYISFSEYDLNHKGIIFREETHATEFIRKQLEACGSGESVEDYMNDGLATITEVDIYDPND